MPLISIKATKQSIKHPEKLLKAVSTELTKLTGKPESYVMTMLDEQVSMTFAGNSDPCCYLEVKSIGSLKPMEMANSLCKLIESETGIKTNRIYINFDDIEASKWGFNCRTFG